MRISTLFAGMVAFMAPAAFAQSIDVYFFSDGACTNQITDITLGGNGVCYDTSNIIDAIFPIAPYSSITLKCGGGVATGTFYASIFSDGSQCDSDGSVDIPSIPTSQCYALDIPGTSVGISMIVSC